MFYAGGTVVLSPSPSPDVAFPLVARERVTDLGLVPPLALLWAQAAAAAIRRYHQASHDRTPATP